MPHPWRGRHGNLDARQWEANSFNAIRVTADRVEVETHRWSGGGFERTDVHTFDRAGPRWRRAQG